jgi:hypothetical protein
VLGKIVKCPDCQEKFKVAKAVEEPPAETAVMTRAAKSRPTPPSDYEEERPRRRRRNEEAADDHDDDALNFPVRMPCDAGGAIAQLPRLPVGVVGTVPNVYDLQEGFVEPPVSFYLASAGAGTADVL